jgi:hypothetical protein
MSMKRLMKSFIKHFSLILVRLCVGVNNETSLGLIAPVVFGVVRIGLLLFAFGPLAFSLMPLLVWESTL